MPVDRPPDVAARTRGRSSLVAPAGACVAAVIALFALAQRWQEASVVSGRNVMAPATALAVIFASTALLLIRRPATMARHVGQVAATVAMTFGLIVVVRYVAGFEIGVRPGELPNAGSWWAARPSPTAGFALALIGAALLTLGFRHEAAHRWGRYGAIATLVIALIGLIGHAYGASALYSLDLWGRTSASTSLALGALALGVIFADPSQGIAAILGSGSSGGRLLRALTPVALLAPLLLGWLSLTAQAVGLLPVPLAMALLIVALMLLFVGFIARQAAVLHAADAERERLLAREREARGQVTRILESITDAFFTVDQDWRFTYVNGEAERLLQKPRDQLLGRNIWREFPGAVGTIFERSLRRAVTEQNTVQFEAFYEPLGRWFDVRAYPGPDGLSVYFRDVTTRRQADERLRESEERYRLLADMVPQHIWTADPDGNHNYFSRRWYEYSGSTLEQAQGDGWLGLVHPADRERTLARWRHSVRTGEPYSNEYRLRDADGRYRWFLGQAMPMRDSGGVITQWFGTVTDISERMQLEQDRERLLREAQEAHAEAERRREDLERVTESHASLMRGFSHDVRNALGAAHLNAELLEQGRIGGDLSDKQRESVRRIRRSVRTALQLIDDLLELARAEAGQLKLQFEDTDVRKAAREVADDFRQQAAAAGIGLGVEVPEDLRVKTDPARLRQILANLLSNAVKYALNSPVTIEAAFVRSGAPGPGPWVAVRVRDGGPGIAEEDRESIFQEYTRLDPRAAHGAGIGLAISRRIARLMGGDLTVESELGGGATFTLWLPATAGVEARG